MSKFSLGPTAREIVAKAHPEHALHSPAEVISSNKRYVSIGCSCGSKLFLGEETAKSFGMDLSQMWDRLKKLIGTMN